MSNTNQAQQQPQDQAQDQQTQSAQTAQAATAEQQQAATAAQPAPAAPATIPAEPKVPWVRFVLCSLIGAAILGGLIAFGQSVHQDGYRSGYSAAVTQYENTAWHKRVWSGITGNYPR